MIAFTYSSYFIILYLPVQLPILSCFFLPLSPSIAILGLFLEVRLLQSSIIPSSGSWTNFLIQPTFLLLRETIQACQLLFFPSAFPHQTSSFTCTHIHPPNLSVCSFPTHGRYLSFTSFHFWSISWQMTIIPVNKGESRIRHLPPSTKKEHYSLRSNIMQRSRDHNL